jgi:hypothetical protein
VFHLWAQNLNQISTISLLYRTDDTNTIWFTIRRKTDFHINNEPHTERGISVWPVAGRGIALRRTSFPWRIIKQRQLWRISSRTKDWERPGWKTFFKMMQDHPTSFPTRQGRITEILDTLLQTIVEKPHTTFPGGWPPSGSNSPTEQRIIFLQERLLVSTEFAEYARSAWTTFVAQYYGIRDTNWLHQSNSNFQETDEVF